MSRVISFYVSNTNVATAQLVQINNTTPVATAAGGASFSGTDEGSGAWSFQVSDSSEGSFALKVKTAGGSYVLQKESAVILKSNDKISAGTSKVEVSSTTGTIIYGNLAMSGGATVSAINTAVVTTGTSLVTNQSLYLVMGALNGGGTNYLTAETTMWGALSALDTQIKTNANAIAAINLGSFTAGNTGIVTTITIRQNHTDYYLMDVHWDSSITGFVTYEGNYYWDKSSTTSFKSWSGAAYVDDVHSLRIDPLNQTATVKYKGSLYMNSTATPRLFVRIRAKDSDGDYSGYNTGYGDFDEIPPTTNQEIVDAVIQELKSRNKIVDSAGNTFQIQPQNVYNV